MNSEHTPLYALLGLIVILLLISITIQLRQQETPTSWATLKSSELHTFFGSCRDGGGSLDVRAGGGNAITFVCQYADRMVEYMLSPGK